jgi:hypothetical protein
MKIDILIISLSCLCMWHILYVKEHLFVEQDRSVVEYTRGTNSTVLPDHSVTPKITGVVKSLYQLGHQL